MRYALAGLLIAILGIGVCLIAENACAQQEGFLEPSSVAPPASDSMLPPGAVVQGAYVQHTIQSRQENLHLLASFYYGNPREWRKIYDDNRNVITNPNRLPVNETIRIHVGENWQPKVAYNTWFALAVRNGEWQSDVLWQRANTAAVPPGPPPKPAAATTPPESPVPTPPSTPTPTPTPQPSAIIPEEAPPSEHPADEPTEEPAEEPENAESESASTPEPTDSEQPPEPPGEEDAPAEPAF